MQNVLKGPGIGAARDPARLGFLFTCGLFLLEFHNPIDGPRIWNLTIAAIAMLAFLIALNRYVGGTLPSIKLFGQDHLFLLFLLWAGFSVLWAPSKADAVFHASVGVIVWLGLIGVRHVDVFTILRYFFQLVILVAAASAIVLAASPDLAFQPSPSNPLRPEFRGVFAHQQRLNLLMGTAAAVAVLVVINGHSDRVFPQYRVRGVVGVGVLSTVYMVAAFGRLNMLYCFVALVLALLFCSGKVKRTVAAFVSLLAAGAVWLAGPALLQRLDGGDFDLTLTGRTHVWAVTQNATPGNRLIGHGFRSFLDPQFDNIWGNYRPPHAHNSFLQTYFELGVVGLVILLALVYSQIRTAIRLSDAPGSGIPYSMMFVLIATLSSLTGLTYGGEPRLALYLGFVVLGSEWSASQARGEPEDLKSAIQNPLNSKGGFWPSS